MLLGSVIRSGLGLFIDVQRLKEDPELKKNEQKLFDQLESKANHNGHVNLTPLVREYMEKLWEVHQSMRGWMSADLSSWDHTIISVQDRARAAFGEHLSGLSVVAEEKDREGDYPVVDSARIYIEPIEWRKHLEAKNRDFGRLPPLYVTEHAGRPRHR